jgi:hypothetical protein
MINIKIIGIFIAAAIGIGFAQNIGNIIPAEPKTTAAFYQEEITLTVSDSVSRVEGTYHFRNNTGKAIDMPVIFPFYVDSTTEFPYHIGAFLMDDKGHEQPIKFEELRNHKAIRMRIPLAADGETTWYLNYEQKIRARRAVYIITSTAAWQKPLEQATYTFIAPSSFEDIKVWPEPDTTFEKAGQIYMQCVKYDFMPTREMEISWK